VLKIALLLLITISIPLSAFAEPMIELSSTQTEIKSLDSVLVVGKVSGVSTYKLVTLTVVSPDGVIVYAPTLPTDGNGEFRRLIHPPLPSFSDGVYTVTASHPDTEKIAQIQFTVISSASPPKVSPIKPTSPAMPDEKSSAITLSTETTFGSNKIIVTGTTTSFATDITFVVTAPNGNLISIAQITPDKNGKFSTEILSGGALWKENGFYTITANQGLSSEHKKSIQVEIDNGVVVPEFGTIAVMILAVSILSIIAVSAKSRLSIIPRY
jgi:predicted secreted protein with PEFG-CTERM motif